MAEKVSAPKIGEKFSDLYDRARIAERYEQQYLASVHTEERKRLIQPQVIAHLLYRERTQVWTHLSALLSLAFGVMKLDILSVTVLNEKEKP